MNRIKKPAGREPTGKAGNGTKNSREFKRYCTIDNISLSSLLDQALNFIDYHERQALFHREQLAKHRQVKRELERLVPKCGPWPQGGETA